MSLFRHIVLVHLHHNKFTHFLLTSQIHIFDYFISLCFCTMFRATVYGNFESERLLPGTHAIHLTKSGSRASPEKIKEHLFQATVESVLLYGAETWTITNKSKMSLDGCYARMLRSAFHISWKDEITNQELYGDLPPLSDKIKERRHRFAGHCYRIQKEIVSDLVLWKPLPGYSRLGRPPTTYLYMYWLKMPALQ